MNYTGRKGVKYIEKSKALYDMNTDTVGANEYKKLYLKMLSNADLITIQ